MSVRSLLLAIVFFAALPRYSFPQSDNVGSGGAILFDGIDDYIDFGDIYEDLEFPFTVSAWVYLDPSNTLAAPIFTNRNCDPIYTGFRLIVNRNLISLDYGDGLGGNSPAFRRGKNANVDLIAGTWNHITAVVNDVANMDLYLNGVNVGGSYVGETSLPMDSSKPGFSSSAYFISNGVVYRFKGLIDDIRLWNRALSPDEVRNTMCVKLSGSEPGLIGYWDFNESNGTTVFDHSPNQFNGSFVGNPLRVRSGAPIGDVSTYTYTTNWTNRIVTLLNNSQRLRVSNVSSAALGVHVYAVNSRPSNETGLPDKSNESYFGVFVAQQLSSSTFSISLSNVAGDVCSAFYRENNSTSPWLPSGPSINNNIKRIEVIQQGTTSTTLDLGADLEICGDEHVEISTGLPEEDYQIQWNTGETTSSIVVNETGWYVVTAKGSCTDMKDSVHVARLPFPRPLSLGEDVRLCNEREHQILADFTEDHYQIQWNTGEITPSIMAQTSGWYVATVTGPCAQLKDSVKVEFLTTPYNFSLGEDILACEFKEWILEVPDDPSFQVLWEDGSNQSKREVKNAGTYWATLSNACGVTSDTIKIKMISREASAPNVITPNGDELNESFVIDNETEIPISLEIFNRWGERVHYSPSYDNQWSGTGLASGVYYFIMHNGCLGSRKGVVNILR